jgi:hypothetical protein
MALSARDRGILAQMAHHLAADDPGLARLLTGFARRDVSRRFASFPGRMVAVGIVGGACLALCVLALTVHDRLWLAVIGALLFALGTTMIAVGILPVLARRPGQAHQGVSGPAGRRPSR